MSDVKPVLSRIHVSWLLMGGEVERCKRHTDILAKHYLKKSEKKSYQCSPSWISWVAFWKPGVALSRSHRLLSVEGAMFNVCYIILNNFATNTSFKSKNSVNKTLSEIHAWHGTLLKFILHKTAFENVFAYWWLLSNKCDVYLDWKSTPPATKHSWLVFCCWG